MRASREVFLTLRDVEKLIRDLEEEYGFSTAQFLRNAELRKNVPEDDIFKWEAFIDHRRELRKIHEDLHRQYLAKLPLSSVDREKTPTTEDLLSLAA